MSRSFHLQIVLIKSVFVFHFNLWVSCNLLMIRILALDQSVIKIWIIPCAKWQEATPTLFKFRTNQSAANIQAEISYILTMFCKLDCWLVQRPSLDISWNLLTKENIRKENRSTLNFTFSWKSASYISKPEHQ